MSWVPLGLLFFPGLLLLGIGAKQRDLRLGVQVTLRAPWVFPGIHGVLALGSALFFPGLIQAVTGVAMHGVLGLFYGVYLGSLNVSQPQKRSLALILFSVLCFLGLWILVGIDRVGLDRRIYTETVALVAAQAESLKQALVQSQVSPYDLPEGIRLLLQQGAKPWSEWLVGQLPLAVFGGLLALFFLYWNLFDYRLKPLKLRLAMHYQVPDWAMIVLVLCLSLLAFGLSFDVNLDGKKSAQMGQALQVFLIHPNNRFFQVGFACLVASLWWYAYEGVFVLYRKGLVFRRFWLFFLMLFILFFSAQAAVLILMALGVITQTRRFLPKKQGQ
jgi:hypothetical protein